MEVLYDDFKIKISPYIKLKTTNKKILQYDINGNFIKEWESLKKAYDHINNNSTLGGLSVNMKGRGFYKNYFWRYKKFDKIPLTIPVIHYSVKKKIAQYSLNWELLNIFDSVADTAKFLNCQRTYFGKIMLNKNKNENIKYRGYYWKYYTNELINK